MRPVDFIPKFSHQIQHQLWALHVLRHEQRHLAPLQRHFGQRGAHRKCGEMRALHLILYSKRLQQAIMRLDARLMMCGVLQAEWILF